MNPEFKDLDQESEASDSGSFYEPRTIPQKWDVSAFAVPTSSDQNDTGEQSAEPVELSKPENSEDDSTNWSPDPFPQPRTIPGKWDVSDMK
jgi:hypothetical protein